MQLDKLIAEWLELGLQDLNSAKFLMNMKPVPLEIVGFHCQQAVEKYLKAYLIKHDIEPDKTHDLLFLLSQCKKYDEQFITLTQTCAQLTEYAVKIRYPYPGSLDIALIQHGLHLADEAISFIKAKLSVSGNT